jgi:hypothetical protein
MPKLTPEQWEELARCAERLDQPLPNAPMFSMRTLIKNLRFNCDIILTARDSKRRNAALERIHGLMKKLFTTPT